MWDYKITKTSLGYNVYRTREEDGMIELEWLQGNGFTWNKELAKTFYTLDNAISALVIHKIQGKTDAISKKQSQSEDKEERKSWREY